MPKERVLFLYYELADYFLACANELSINEEVERVDIVHYPVNKEAPFDLLSAGTCHFHSKQDFDKLQLSALIEKVNPTFIVCCGWADKDYNAIVKGWHKLVPVVLVFDNWWFGSLKQRLLALAWKTLFRKRFSSVWIPGLPQESFAKKLGFALNQIQFGYYCANPTPFLETFSQRQQTSASKKILYTGRYIESKGIQELWAAFANLSNEFSDWELHCIGMGDLWEYRVIHPKIIHHGFVQPRDLHEHIVDAAFFVMPSKKEPWGVVLHEMAIAGLPLLASKMVGSYTKFVQEGVNGRLFSIYNLEQELRQMMMLSDSERLEMGKHSHRLGTQYLPQDWAETVLNLAKG